MWNINYIILISLHLTIVLCENETVTIKDASDSYLEAYKDAKALNGAAVKKINNRDYDVNGGPYPGSVNNHYGPPDYNYGPPKPIYGPPSYPPPNYGPPNYYPPQEPTNGIPHALIEGLLSGILNKFKLKLDLFTLGKILLKIVLFKKLVSFIGIICLLLFIPWLKNVKGEDKSLIDELRYYKNEVSDDFLNRLTVFASEAIEKYNNVSENVNL